MGGHELVLTFSFEFLRFVSTLVLSRFPGLVQPVLLALLLVKKGKREGFVEHRRGSFVKHRRGLLLSFCSLLVQPY